VLTIRNAKGGVNCPPLLIERQGVVNLGVLVPRENGEMQGKVVGVIDANHRRIGIFTSREDQNYKRVMSSIRDLIDKIITREILPPTLELPGATAHTMGLRVLALGMTFVLLILGGIA
jgi:hypothetical protein